MMISATGMKICFVMKMERETKIAFYFLLIHDDLGYFLFKLLKGRQVYMEREEGRKNRMINKVKYSSYVLIENTFWQLYYIWLNNIFLFVIGKIMPFQTGLLNILTIFWKWSKVHLCLQYFLEQRFFLPMSKFVLLPFLPSMAPISSKLPQFSDSFQFD